MKTFDEFLQQIQERNAFERRAEKRAGIPYSDEELQRQRNVRHLSGPVDSAMTNQKEHDATTKDRQEFNKEKYTVNHRRNVHKRKVVNPVTFNGLTAVNQTQQYDNNSRANQEWLNLLRNRRTVRRLNKSL